MMRAIKGFIPLLVLTVAFFIANLIGVAILSSGPALRDLTGGEALHVQCPDAGPLLSTLKSAAAAPQDTGEHQQVLRKLGFDPGVGVKSGKPDQRIAVAVSALEKRIKDCP